MKAATYLGIFLLLLGLTAAVSAEEAAAPLAGHSFHGEVFNEGPRQAAVLIPGTGEVHLEVTTDSDEARLFFNQGLGQLHGYWFFEAERSFRQAAALDPDCAMAYWGMAMANFKNDARGGKFIAEAVERKDLVSDRERLWIDGLAAYFKNPKADLKKRLRDHVRSLEGILLAYPEEIEAEAFLLHQIYYNSGKDLAVSSHYAMDLLARKILTKYPNHPANHFRIHLWDKTDPARALGAAAACGPSAPAIAHMWHMPGHIYSALHRYADAVWQQEASARIDHAHTMRHRILPDQIHNFAHNNEWLIRNFDSLGEHRRAVALARNMISLPRLAKFKKEGGKEVYDPSGSSWQYGRQRLRDTLVRYEAWSELIALSGDGKDRTSLLHPDGKSIAEIDYHRFVGLARFESGDHEGGLGHLDAAARLLKKKQDERDRAVSSAKVRAEAAKKDPKGIEAAGKSAAKNFEKAIAALEAPVDELRVYAALAADPPDLAGALDLLPKLKGVAKSRHALLWLRAGGREEARKLAAEAVKSAEGELLPLVAQVRVLDAVGDPEECAAAFAALRPLASRADPDLAMFAPLAPIAKKLGLPADWILEPEAPGDLGQRPELDSLGPAVWSPPAAPKVEVLRADGAPELLVKPGGRPVLAIFYLGKACSHCMEQLNTFAPFAERYAGAGIDLVAVGSDEPAGLATTLASGEGGSSPFPFPLRADPSLAAFKSFRAYDDFEAMPLHGVFLIDGAGRVRWQDIGYEPFSHPEWLLGECVRLLSFGAAEKPKPAGLAEG